MLVELDELYISSIQSGAVAAKMTEIERKNRISGEKVKV